MFHMRILPYMFQEITKVTNSSGTFSGGGSAYVVKIYSFKLNGGTSLHEQIIKFEKLVKRGIEFTPIPVGSPPNTSIHPALQDHCNFQILASTLVEFSQIIPDTESRIVLLNILSEIQMAK